MWTLDDELISCLAASEVRMEVVLGRSDGSVQLWGVGEWKLRATLDCGSGVSRLMYGSINSNRSLPHVFLLVSPHRASYHGNPIRDNV